MCVHTFGSWGSLLHKHSVTQRHCCAGVLVTLPGLTHCVVGLALVLGVSQRSPTTGAMALHSCVKQTEDCMCHFKAFLMVRKGEAMWWDMVAICFSGTVSIL